MADSKPPSIVTKLPGELLHLPKSRTANSSSDDRLRELEFSIAAHFMEQNNRELGEKIQRLTNGFERLVSEMHGIRTGRSDEAFARIGPVDAAPDLPTVSGEAALFYIYTASQIGEQLGFHATQIGLLLGARGLKWVGDGTYQEIGRATKPSQSKFWHREVPDKLKRILNEGRPEKFGITSKAVIAIFKNWKDGSAAHELLENLDTTDVPH